MKDSGVSGVVTLIVGASLLVASQAGAAIVLHASPVAATVVPGSSFNITFTADATGGDGIWSYQFSLASSGGSGMFEVSARNTAGSLFTDIVPGSHTWPDALDLQTNQAFGGGDPGISNHSGTGLFLSTFTIDVSPTATGGPYTISAVDWFLSDNVGNMTTTGSTPDTVVTLVVVPEPASLAMLLLLLPSGLLLRRRRRG